MRKHRIDRRTVLAGATALGAAGAFPAPAVAQRETTGQAPIGGASLPALGEFVVRGANVLTMDPALGDLASGDVRATARSSRSDRGSRQPAPSRSRGAA